MIEDTIYVLGYYHLEFKATISMFGGRIQINSFPIIDEYWFINNKTDFHSVSEKTLLNRLFHSLESP